MSKVDQPGERAHFSFMSCDEDAYLTMLNIESADFE